MQAIDFVIDTLSHFVRRKEGPPPGIPAQTDPDFEQELTWLCEWHSLTAIVLASLERLALKPNISRITLERIRALAGASEAMTNDLGATAEQIAKQLAGVVDGAFAGGVHLARDLYPQAALRPVDEIEMFVKETEWSAVIERCGQAGFRLASGVPFFRNGDEALGYYQHFTVCMLENDRRDRLHLRMRIFDVGEPESAEAAWRRTRVLPGSGIRCIGLEDELIRSCLRYNMSDFGKLLHAVDIGLILGRDDAELDWAYIDQRVRSRAVYPAFWITLNNVIQWLRLEQPPPIQAPGRLRKKLFDTMWHSNYDSFAMRRPERSHRYRFCLLETGSLRARLRFVGALLSPRPEWVAAFFGRPYHPWLKLRFVLLTFRNRVGLRPTGNS